MIKRIYLRIGRLDDIRNLGQSALQFGTFTFVMRSWGTFYGVMRIAMVAARMIFRGKNGGRLIIRAGGVNAVRQTAAKKR